MQVPIFYATSVVKLYKEKCDLDYIPNTEFAEGLELIPRKKQMCHVQTCSEYYTRLEAMLCKYTEKKTLGLSGSK